MTDYTGATLIEALPIRHVGKCALIREGFETLGDLMDALDRSGDVALMRLPNFGRKSLNDVRDIIKKAGKPAPAKADRPQALCVMQIVDGDNAVSHEVTHHAAAYITVIEYGKTRIDLDYEQAKALAWALQRMCEIHE